MDNSQDWDKVECVVEREQQQKNLARKEWVAVQAKTLKENLTQERFDDIVKKRTDAGLYYADADYPDDPMDTGSQNHTHHR